MARRKEQDTSFWTAALGVLGALLETAQAVSDIQSGKTSKVNVSGHYRKDGRGGKTWVEGHKRSYPL